MRKHEAYERIPVFRKTGVFLMIAHAGAEADLLGALRLPGCVDGLDDPLDEALLGGRLLGLVDDVVLLFSSMVPLMIPPVLRL